LLFGFFSCLVFFHVWFFFTWCFCFLCWLFLFSFRCFYAYDFVILSFGYFINSNISTRVS
jgi:hypothetical protein